MQNHLRRPASARRAWDRVDCAGTYHRLVRSRPEVGVIIVDELFDGSPFYHGPYADRARAVGERNQHLWCHLASTTSDDELHAFAEQLGLTRRSFDRDHYDLTPARRTLAISLGAVEVTADELMFVLKYDRRGLARPGR